TGHGRRAGVAADGRFKLIGEVRLVLLDGGVQRSAEGLKRALGRSNLILTASGDALVDGRNPLESSGLDRTQRPLVLDESIDLSDRDLETVNGQLALGGGEFVRLGGPRTLDGLRNQLGAAH